MTVIVPIMLGWIAQWYGYEPGSVKVKRNSCPESRFPESKAPVSEVAVWASAAVFVQQTMVPAGISTVAGSKAKSTIATIVSDSSHEPETRCGADPADTPACGISSAPKPIAVIAAARKHRRK